MHETPDYYRILNVQPDAPVEIIRSCYRTLMQELKQHPDLGGEHQQAILINEAYATLCDAHKREAYDRQRQAHIRREPSAFTNIRIDDPRQANHRPVAHTATIPRDVCAFCQRPHGHGQHLEWDAQCASCGAPLYIACRPQQTDSDRRALQRYRKEHRIRFYTTWPQDQACTGQSHDISHHGMKFVTTEAVSVNQLLKIDCEVCSAVAQVRHCERQRDGFKDIWVVGVAFLTLRFEQPQGTFLSRTV